VRRYLDGRAMDDVAMDRMRTFAARAVEMHADGFWLAFSGGKDSVVLLDLAERSGVPFTAHYSLTTVDPPEVVWFIKTFPQVRIERPPLTMWKLIRKRQQPPRRQARYCCQELKERGGSGRMVLTGVRWAESAKRRTRQMAEACFRDSRKFYLHPIIDWPTDAVWEYIRERDLRYCCLYDEGFRRVGCVLCPCGRKGDVERALARWPKLCAAWERAIKTTWKPGNFPTPEAYWRWWLDRDAPSPKADDELTLFEDDPADDGARLPWSAPTGE